MRTKCYSTLGSGRFWLALVCFFLGGLGAHAANFQTADGESASGDLQFTTSGSIFVHVGGDRVAQLRKGDLTADSMAMVAAWEGSNPSKSNLSTKFDSRPQPVRMRSPQRDGSIANLSGVVMLAVVVNESGSVEDAYVKDSSDPRFNSASVDAIRGWEFTPLTVASKPSRGMMFVPLQY